MFGSGFRQNVINLIQSKKRIEKKMYGSYKSYEDSKDKERAERRIYRYAEASEVHLKRIRDRFKRQHKALFQKKVAVLTGCVMLGVIAMLVMFYF